MSLNRERAQKRGLAGFLSGTTTLVAAALFSTGATAQSAQDESLPQQQQTQAAPAPPQNEDIIVTGTRVPRPDYAYSNPVTSVGAEAIQYSGANNVTEFLTELPALVNSTDSNDASGANAGIGATGLNLLNLRNLGEDRTLVLINGRRHVASFPGSAAVDTATIPIDLIERVDVSTGGASAIYGADGVSGVVNFIMVDDFEGLRFRAQSGWTEEGGAEDQRISALWGFNSDNNRANLTLAAEYTHEGKLLVGDRDYLREPNYVEFVDNPDEVASGFDDPDLPDLVPLSGIRLDVISAIGAVDVDFDGIADFDGNGAVWDHGLLVDTNGTFTQGGSGLSYEQLFTDVLPEVDRYALNAFFHYDFNPGLRFFTELKYVNTQSFSEGQPTFDQFNLIAPDNPFIPDAVVAAMDPSFGVLLSSWNSGLGNRGEEITRETFRGVFGLRGDVSENVNFEVSAVYGATATESLNTGNRWNDRYVAALDVVDADPGPGVNPVCRSNIDPDAVFNDPNAPFYPPPTSFTPGPNSGCVPLNSFGDNVSQAARDWINVTTRNTSLVSQTVLTGYINGTLDSWFKLPGGSVGFAVGAEYREETSRATFDERDQAGLTFMNILPNARGEFDVSEGFAEINLPFLSDRPFFETLSLDAAVRLSDYSTTGQATTWKIGGVWAPVEDLSFRGTIAQAVRAPNIGELFDPGGQDFQGINDPCDIDNLNQGSDTREANCAAILGALGVDPTTFEDPNNTGVEGVSTGNTELSEETADTTTIGLIFRPRWVHNLVVSVDWYDIDLQDAVNTPSPQEIAVQCVDAPSIDNKFCDALDRRASDGGIDFFRRRPENVASFTTRGTDFSVSYAFQPEDWGWGPLGNFTARLVGNHLDDLTFINLPGADPDTDHYEVGAPEWQASFDLIWQRGPWLVNYGYNYFSETQRFNTALREAEPDISDARYFDYDARSVHDVHVRYSFGERLELYGGINNIGNQQPDLAETYYPVGAEGRSFYVGLNLQMN